MKKLAIIAATFCSIAVLYSCKKEKEVAPAGVAYLDLPASNNDYFPGLSAIPQYQDSLNSVATLGRVLFYDSHLSLNNSVSCATCHKQELGFADNVQFSRGFEGKFTGRNTPGLNGVGVSGSLFWDGRERDLTNLIMRPVSNHVEMGIDDLSALPGKLAALPYYKDLFVKAFHDGNITNERISTAVALFVSTIGISNNTKVIAGVSTVNAAPMTAIEVRGKELFDNTYKCGSCHLGNGGYGGGSFFDIGLDDVYTDKGLGQITGFKENDGMFKAPSLTNVALTAPYMHDGRYKTLDDVLEHYSHGIRNSPNLSVVLQEVNETAPEVATHIPLRLNIKDEDKKALIAFLQSLTDYDAIVDSKFSNPFKVK